MRTELGSGDVVEIFTSPVSTPNPAWLGFVRTGKARSRIMQHLKSLQHEQSRELGERLLAQALRAQGLLLPPDKLSPIWEQLSHYSGSRSPDEMMANIGLGKCSASAIAKHMGTLLAAQGIRPDALLMTRERYTAHESLSQGAVLLDGAQNVSIRYASCCMPIPGDPVIGYLGRGEGLVVHTEECVLARRLRQKDAESFVTVTWTDDPVRTFPVGIVVTVSSQLDALSNLTSTLSRMGVGIAHLTMPADEVSTVLNLRLIIKVKDASQLDSVLRTLRRTPAVSRAERARTMERD